MTSATDLALKAFETRPTRAEALADLARHHRDLGMNEVAATFARRGLAIPPSNDLLFVETWATEELRTTLAICGYYSCDPATRAAAAAECNRLALDRDVSCETRDLARRNLEYYLRPIAEVFPSWQARRLTFTPPDGYAQMAPSVTRYNDRILAAQRCVNYKIDARGYVEIKNDRPLNEGGRIRTKTLLLELDQDTLIESVHGEIQLPADFPAALQDVITGFEDMRLFSWRGELWSLSTVLDQNVDARAEQWLARVGSNLRMANARPINPQPLRARDKNWMPVVEGDTLRFIYQCDPTRIIDTNGETIAETTPDIAADHFSGSSQAIPFASGWLTVIHWRQWFDNWPRYRHRFAWFDEALRLKRVSPGWIFADHAPDVDVLKGYEYCTGLTPHPDDDRLIIGYQIHERESWVGTLKASEVATVLKLPPLSSPRLAEPSLATPGLTWPSPAPPKVSIITGSKEVVNLELDDDEAWVRSQTNRALQSMADVDRATQILEQHKLPQHPDQVKNWDNVLALWHAAQRKDVTDGKAAVLDAGGDHRSAFLPGMRRLDLNNLINLNLTEPNEGFREGITWVRGDITNTRLGLASLNFVACLSVLEHGVDVNAFLCEMARTIVRGGQLFLSVDYWETPVSTAHVVFQGPYAGQRWEIFTKSSVERLIEHARSVGLHLSGDVDLRCRDRVCHHLGCQFTFLNLLFQR